MRHPAAISGSCEVYDKKKIPVNLCGFWLPAAAGSTQGFQRLLESLALCNFSEVLVKARGFRLSAPFRCRRAPEQAETVNYNIAFASGASPRAKKFPPPAPQRRSCNGGGSSCSRSRHHDDGCAQQRQKLRVARVQQTPVLGAAHTTECPKNAQMCQTRHTPLHACARAHERASRAGAAHSTRRKVTSAHVCFCRFCPAYPRCRCCCGLFFLAAQASG